MILGRYRCDLDWYPAYGDGLPTRPNLFVTPFGVHEHDLTLSTFVTERLRQANGHPASVGSVNAWTETFSLDVHPPFRADHQNDVALDASCCGPTLPCDCFHGARKRESVHSENLWSCDLPVSSGILCIVTN